MKRPRLIAATLIVCATIVLIAVAIIRHVNNTQDAAWCRDHGYPNSRPMTGSASEQLENSSKLISSPKNGCRPPRFIFESVSICVVNARCNRDRVRAHSRGRLAAIFGLLVARFIGKNIDKWTKVIKFAGIKPP